MKLVPKNVADITWTTVELLTIIKPMILFSHFFCSEVYHGWDYLCLGQSVKRNLHPPKIESHPY